MSELRKCEKCGTELSADSAGPQCTKCADLPLHLNDPPRTATRTLKVNPLSVPMPSSVPSIKSKQFGDYELVEGIAQGGMGAIYKARQISLDRLVALKTVLAGLLAGEDQIKRFRTEAEAVANLDHPNIIPIYEVGEHEGQFYFSMKLIETGSLEDQIERYKSDHKAAAKLMAAVARAVHYAHQHGILHRDLKPDNILIDANGTPYVTDFGLAKKVGENSQMTVTGEIIGTPNYMSPEQAEGKKHIPTTAVDVYGLGAILYKILTGKPPFQAESPLETIRLVTEQEPQRPSTLNNRADRELETICLKCMEKNPARRYDSALDVAEDLERWLNNEPILARPAGALTRSIKWVRRRPAIATMLAVIVVAIGSFIGLTISNDAKLKKERDIAEENARQSKLNEIESKRNAEESRRNAEESKLRLVRINVGDGLRLLEEGDTSGALLYVNEALRLVAGDKVREEAQRIRYGVMLRQCPKFVGFWVESSEITAAATTPKGDLIATATLPDKVVLHKRITGEVVGKPLTHPAKVNSIVFSPDGKLLATTCTDGAGNDSVYVWNVARSELAFDAILHTGAINSLTFSPDGSTLLTACHDQYARLWRVANGKPVGVAIKHRSAVEYAAFSHDGRLIVTTSRDSTARVWDAETGKAVTEPLKHNKDVVNFAAFSPDDRFVITCGQDRTARIWEIATSLQRGSPLQHNGPVTHAEFSPDGRQVVTSNKDNTARVWDVEIGEPVTPPLTHNTRVLYATFSPDGHSVLTRSEKTARIWEISAGQPSAGQPLTPPMIQSQELLLAAFNPSGQEVTLISRDKSVKIWNVAVSQPTHRVLDINQPVRSAIFSPDRGHFLTVAEKNAQLWTFTRDGTPPTSQTISEDAEILAAQFGQEGRRVDFVLRNQGLSVWNLRKKDQPEKFFPPAPKERRFRPNLGAFNKDGSKVIMVDYDHKAFVSEPFKGKLERPIELDATGHILHVAFSPDANKVVAACEDNKARIWNLKSEHQPSIVLEHKDRVVYAEFSPDGHYVVTASWDGTARVWDAETGKPVGTPLEHIAEVLMATFSPNSLQVITTSADNTARVWDTLTGNPITPYLQHSGWVVHAAFSADGGRVVTASVDNTARVWDAVTGEPISPPLQHKKQVDFATFSPDGRFVVTCSADGTARIWNLPPDERSLDDLNMLAHLLSGRRIDATGSLTPVKLETLQDAWTSLRNRYRRNFDINHDQVVAWEQDMADTCEENKEWFGAIFHLKELIKDSPNDATLKSRLDSDLIELNKLKPAD